MVQSSSSEPLLEVSGLTISAPGADRPIVDDLSLSIAAGETLAVVGESGAGKSMTGFAVLGLVPQPLQVTGGTVLWKGRDLRSLPERELRAVRGREIGMIFQEPSAAMNPARTIGSQLAEVLRLHRSMDRKTARAAAADLLAQMGIADPVRACASWPHELSGGMLQRTAIAIAMAGEPDLIIADEPTTALDASVQRGVLELLANLQQSSGLALLFITHNLGLVAEMADRVLVMRHGRAIEQATVLDLFDAPQADHTRELLTASHGEGNH